MGQVRIKWFPPGGYIVFLDGEPVQLPAALIRMLELFLLRRPGYAVSLADLTAWLWPNPDDEPETGYHMVYVYIARLRKRGVMIENVAYKSYPDIGYGGWSIPVKGRAGSR